MKLLGSTKSKIIKDENDKSVPHLEITKVTPVHGNTVISDYQHDSRVLCSFAPNKLFGQSLDISPKDFIISNTFNSEFPYIEVWFTDKNSKPLEIGDKTNITLVIK